MRSLKRMYAALVERAEEKAATDNDYVQTLVASARRSLPNLPVIDVEMLNDYLFDGKPMVWSAKDGFQPGRIG